MGDTSIHRSVTILNYMAERPSGVRFGELQEALGGISASTVTRIIKILCDDTGVIERRKAGGYVIGERVLHWAAAVPKILTLAELARPIMREINEKYRVTVILFEHYGETMGVVEKFTNESSPALLEKGKNVPVSLNVLGAAYFIDPALGSREVMARIKNVDKKESALGMDVVCRMLEQGRRREVIDDEGAFMYGRRLAVPVIDRDDRIVAALGVGISYGVANDEKFVDELRRVLMREGFALSKRWRMHNQ